MSFEGSGPSEFHTPKDYLKVECSTEEYLNVVSSIIDSKVPNYKSCRVALESRLNIAAWQSNLQEYHDKEVVNLMQFGFPLGVRNNHLLTRTSVKNHSTANEHPEAIKKYIKKERSEGALMGPFSNPPHTAYHFSPMLTRPKGENQRRVIVDLSYGDTSVNKNTDKGAYEGRKFTLQLPTLDNLIHQV